MSPIHERPPQPTPARWAAALTVAVAMLSVGNMVPAFGQGVGTGPDRAGPSPTRASPALIPTAPTAQPEPDLALGDVEIVARRLDAARLSIQPSLGATRTDFNRQAIEAIPLGDNARLNDVLVRAPGVVQDVFGNIFVRGDHRNVQYRINGVQLPEGLAGFAASLNARFVNNVALLTGALPAQYGFRTAGVVDIQTKTGLNSPGTTISLYGGSRGVLQPSFEYGGRSGPLDYYVTGDYLHTDIGVESPTSGFNARNDQSNQGRGFAYAGVILDDTTRLTLMVGGAYGDFRIPTQGGQSPQLGLTVNGVGEFISSNLRESQREYQQFAIVSLQKQTDSVNLQTSVFSRNNVLYYSPDPLGDLLYLGNAQTARRQITSTGLQSDASWRVSDNHTLRGGFLAQVERTSSRVSNLVLPVDGTGLQTSDQPLTILDKSARTGGFYGVYFQDEWRIAPKVTINLGARFDIVDQFTHQSQLSPRINLVYNPWETTTLHIGYARYFNPPPFELIADLSLARLAATTAQPAVFLNDTVKAERSNYFDIGAQHTMIPGLTIGVDAYYKKGQNIIDEGNFGSPILLTAFNYANGEVTGLELSGTYDQGPISLFGNLSIARAIGRTIVSSQFNFSPADLAYINNRYIHLDHDQRFTGSAGAAYTFMQGQPTPLRLAINVLTASGLRASNSTVPNGRALSGYATLGLSAIQKLDPSVLGGRGRGTELRHDVINLLDRKYVLRDGSNLGVGNPQYGLRRAILAGLSQKF